MPTIADQKQVLQFDVILSGDKQYSIDLISELKTDSNKMEEELMKQPGKFAWFSALWELARSDELQAKQEMDKLYGHLYVKYKTNPPSDLVTSRGLTETTLNSLVLMDVAYLKAQRKYNKAKTQAGMLFSAREAFLQRKDALMAINANVRQERGAF